MPEPVNRRFHYVDLLRGLAALAVLICHYRWFYAREIADWRWDAPLPAYSVLWPAYDHGALAVPLFWILSGFVFAIAYGSQNLSTWVFWVKRFSRLYPLHFLTLIIMAGLQAVSMAVFGAWTIYGNNDLPHFVLQLFFASNWFTMTPSFNAPIWSVSVEEVIYFVFLLYLMRRSLVLALILGAGFFVVERFTHAQVPLCGALFFAGVAMARLRLNMLALGLAGLAGTVAVAWFLPKDAVFIYFGAPSVLAIFIGLDQRFPFPRRLEWFGLSTYSIYLWHMPVLIALKMSVGIVPLWFFAGLVLAISYVSFSWFERPMQRWIRGRLLQRVSTSPESRRSRTPSPLSRPR